jgi:outer membrane protein assembly factor BamD (BamD/ComL family)
MFDRLRTAFGPKRDPDAARSLLEQAEARYRARDFAAAGALYQKAAARAADSPLEEDTLFMLAECQFFCDAYPRATDTYTKLLKKFPGTRRLDDAIARLFAIAQYWQDYDLAKPRWPIAPNLGDKTRRPFDTLGHALKIYETIRLTDPTGPRADDTLMATAAAYFTRGRYQDADYYFDLLRREYPKSEFQFEAHLLGLQCKLRKYQGPEYDGRPLEEAEKLARQLLVQFPDKVDKERERIGAMRAEVAAQAALRDWKMAEYYANCGHYTAARLYYRRLVDEQPETTLARRAQQRLAAHAGRPDATVPPLARVAQLLAERRSDASAPAAEPAAGAGNQ